MGLGLRSPVSVLVHTQATGSGPRSRVSVSRSVLSPVSGLGLGLAFGHGLDLGLRFSLVFGDWVSYLDLEFGSQVSVSALGLGFCLMCRSHVWVSCSGLGFGLRFDLGSGLAFRSWDWVKFSLEIGLNFGLGLRFGSQVRVPTARGDSGP